MFDPPSQEKCFEWVGGGGLVGGGLGGGRVGGVRVGVGVVGGLVLVAEGPPHYSLGEFSKEYQQNSIF